jgi:hypothetical protein
MYWDWVFESINFVIDRLSSSHTSPISPFEKLFHKTHDYQFLHTIGCACYPLLRPYNDNKLQPRSDQCVFMGYSQIHKGYRCFHLLSRHVVFNEVDFSFHTASSSSSPSPTHHPSHHLTILPPTTLSPLLTSSPSTAPSPSPNPSSIPSAPPTHHPMLTHHKTNSLKPKIFPNH